MGATFKTERNLGIRNTDNCDTGTGRTDEQRMDIDMDNSICDLCRHSQAEQKNKILWVGWV